MAQLTHLNEKNEAHMVDIGGKAATRRTAKAVGTISMNAQAFEMLHSGAAVKGDVLGVARIAAIQAAKQTGFLIPLCHPLPLTHIRVDFETDSQSRSVHAAVTAATEGATGVEMEALTGVNIALLTIYDMLKAVDKSMIINNIHLAEKTGGKSGDFRFAEQGEAV
ncbi:cyclic pyranopterin monophosphate synthase MoaC [Neisseria sp. ZJ106]|uniref:Cyclic pyranopterin monophosphate synthase n=1 Tax=Neisseria lisongii TaxID=2912188 RepID=A0ABY7RHK2_9NEIS|nr:cyclic pyranopterin monophosphate synthase MoaC [Neisseria lisongii]MCF7522115.1 cyclic pyranopterin monophosphate synthase MoaC [Neisseria lisongii]WCL71114.1 cyclic pyranopterin monophosphate synthase MoaC [Neisseria lisongii]